jgi:hypothetical protein
MSVLFDPSRTLRLEAHAKVYPLFLSAQFINRLFSQNES